MLIDTLQILHSGPLSPSDDSREDVLREEAVYLHMQLA